MSAAARTPALGDLQAGFQAYLLREADEYPAAAVGPVGAAVYAEAYLLRLVEALAADFPALRRVLGTDAFDELARGYVLAHPSTHYSVRWIGQAMEHYLRRTAPYVAEPYLAELAAWEWRLGEAFDARDASPIDAARLQRLGPAEWPTLTFMFHPSLRRLDLRFNVVDLWQAMTRTAAVPPVAALHEPATWILWRRDLDVLYRPVATDEAVALDALRDGAAFGETAERLVAAGSDAGQAPARLATWLAEWLAQGLIVEARVAGAPPTCTDPSRTTHGATHRAGEET